MVVFNETALSTVIGSAENCLIANLSGVNTGSPSGTHQWHHLFTQSLDFNYNRIYVRDTATQGPTAPEVFYTYVQAEGQVVVDASWQFINVSGGIQCTHKLTGRSDHASGGAGTMGGVYTDRMGLILTPSAYVSATDVSALFPIGYCAEPFSFRASLIPSAYELGGTFDSSGDWHSEVRTRALTAAREACPMFRSWLVDIG
tara:strand:- start:848 stop:1450 length:603 start_codon:yes stop_codon:yes gene_type:complete